MNRNKEKDFFDSPSMITFILIGLLIVLIILSQSFAIQNNMEAGDIFRSIINHNSIYLVSLIYFILIRFKFGKKYFDYLNVCMFVFFLLSTFAGLFTIFQSFGFSSILNLTFNVLVSQYYYLLIGIIAIDLVVSLITVNNFEDVVVYLLEAMYEFFLIRYIYLYKEYVEHKNSSEIADKKKFNESVVDDKSGEEVKSKKKKKMIKEEGDVK